MKNDALEKTTKLTISTEAMLEIWRQIYNTAHKILHDAQDFHKIFNILVSEDITLNDTINMTERQIALIRSELRRLISYMSKTDSLMRKKFKSASTEV